MTTFPPQHTAATGSRSAGTTYRITFAGHLDDHWADWLGTRDLTRDDDASTTVTLTATDQAHLHGVLGRIRDIGVNLVALHRDDEYVAAPIAPHLARVLHTERLTLRPANEADATATWGYRRLDSVNEWLSGPPGDFAAYQSTFTEPSRLAATVLVELSDADPEPGVIGDFMLRIEDAWSQNEVAERARAAQAELGWVLDPRHTGAGYATEAVRELLRYCFEELGIHRVVANCFLDNETSWRLMERVGMRRETHAVQESLHRSGQWLDTVGYAALARDWSPTESTSPTHTKESR